MNYKIFSKMLLKINNNHNNFKKLVNIDNTLGLNVSSEDIENILEFSSSTKLLNGPIIGNIIITEGDIKSILLIIHDLVNYIGNYTLFINNDNIGTITYLVKLANEVYEELDMNVKINIDYNNNYNKYLNNMVTIIGSKIFIEEVSIDFKEKNIVII